MSRTRRFLAGITLGYANMALVTLVGIWLTAFLLGRLGDRQYGLWLVGTRLLGYLMLLDFGIVAVLPRETAYATGRAGGGGDNQELPALIGVTTRVVLWQMPAVLLAAALAWISLPASWGALRAPIGIVFAAFALTFPMRVLQAVLQGLQDLAFLGAAQTASWVASTSVTIGLVLAGWGLPALAVGWATGQALSTALWWTRLRRRFPGVLPTRLPPLPWREARSQLVRGFWVSLAQVAQVLLNGSDLLLLGAMLGPAAVVPYFCTAKLVSVLANQPQLLMQSAAPALSEMRTGASRDRLREVCAALTLLMLTVSGAVAVVVIATNAAFVRWWVGPDQFGGLALTGLLVCAMLLRHWNTTAVYAIFAFGRERRISVVTLIDGAVTVGVSLALIHILGIAGAAIGSIVGVVLVSLPANLAALSRETGTTVPALFRQLRPWAWRFALVAAAAVALGLAWRPASLPGLAATAALVGLLYVGMLGPLLLHDPLGAYVRPRLERLRALVLERLSATPDAVHE